MRKDHHMKTQKRVAALDVLDVLDVLQPDAVANDELYQKEVEA